MILTEEEESERRQEEFMSRSQIFMDALDVDDVLAHLLVTEGFSSVEEVAFVPASDLLDIEGFDEEIAEELRNRARTFLTEEEERLTEERRQLGVTDELAAIEGLTPKMLVTLGGEGVKELDDLADLATDELISSEDGVLREFDLTEEEANAIIMAARAHWFDDEDEGEAENAAPAEEAEAAGARMVTTEKDAVRLPAAWRERIDVVRVRVESSKKTLATIWFESTERVCRPWSVTCLNWSAVSRIAVISAADKSSKPKRCLPVHAGPSGVTGWSSEVVVIEKASNAAGTAQGALPRRCRRLRTAS